MSQFDWAQLDDQPTHLDLSNLSLTSNDLKKIKSATFLRSLKLHGNDALDNKALKHLAKLEKLELLDLSGCVGITGGLAPIAKLPLKTLRLDHLSGLTAASLKPLASLTSLEELSLAGCGATDNTAKLVAKLTKLKWLDLSWELPILFARGGLGAGANPPCNYALSSAGLYKLRTLTSLEHLGLRHCFLQNLVGRVQKLPALKSLDISFCWADPDGSSEAYERLKNLKRVQARGASGVATGCLFRDLPKMKLEHLDLAQARIHPSMMKNFFEAKSLRWLRLPSDIEPATVEELRQALPDCDLQFQPPLGYVCLLLDDSLRRTGLCLDQWWLLKAGTKEERVTLRVDSPSLELARKIDGGPTQQATLKLDKIYSNEAEALVNPIDLGEIFA